MAWRQRLGHGGIAFNSSVSSIKSGPFQGAPRQWSRPWRHCLCCLWSIKLGSYSLLMQSDYWRHDSIFAAGVEHGLTVAKYLLQICEAKTYNTLLHLPEVLIGLWAWNILKDTMAMTGGMGALPLLPTVNYQSLTISRGTKALHWGIRPLHKMYYQRLLQWFCHWYAPIWFHVYTSLGVFFSLTLHVSFPLVIPLIKKRNHNWFLQLILCGHNEPHPLMLIDWLVCCPMLWGIRSVLNFRRSQNNTLFC